MLIERQAQANDPCRVLIFVGSDEAAAFVARVLHEHNISTLACRTPEELSTEIEIGGAAVVIAKDCLRDDDQSVILHALDEQRFRDVPLIVLSGLSSDEKLINRLINVSSVIQWTTPYPTEDFAALVAQLVTEKRTVLDSL